jgi:hypothetical protein
VFAFFRRIYLSDPLTAVDVDDGAGHQVAVRGRKEHLQRAVSIDLCTDDTLTHVSNSGQWVG